MSFVDIPASRTSGKNVRNDMPMHVGQPAVDAIVVKHQLLVVDAEQVQNRRVEIGNRNFVFRDEVPISSLAP